MITVATMLWDANTNSHNFSSMYNEEWVNRLYQGFARNLTQPWQFVCYTDRPRSFGWPIIQRQIQSPTPSYGDFTQPYELGDPMILVGLDTVVTGNVDHLADYALSMDRIALPQAIYAPNTCCNGVALVPKGHRHIWTQWRGENDMEWLRSKPHAYIDDLFPGHVVSYKGHVKDCGLGDARIVFFHGEEKPHQLPSGHMLRSAWEG